MTVRVYRSTDPGAPQLTGIAGSLVNILDAVLVNGYNSNNPVGSGWTIAFTNTNQRVYRQPSGSNQMYLRINDTFGTHATMFGCEDASGAGAGLQTGLFPTVVQQASGTNWVKSNTASSDTRGWVAVVTQTMMYFWAWNDSVLGQAMLYWFGDPVSQKSATPGFQRVNFGANWTNNTSSSLVSGTTYTATITIDGTPYSISQLGSTMTTMGAVLDRINTTIGAAGYAVFGNHNTSNSAFTIISATTGNASSVSITPGTLFATPLSSVTGVSAAVAGTTAADIYATVIQGMTSTTYQSVGQELNTIVGYTTATNGGRYMARPIAQVGTSIGYDLYSFPIASTNNSMPATTVAMAFPDPIDRQLMITPVTTAESTPTNTSIVRGNMPGLWSMPHRNYFKMSTITTGDRFTINSGVLLGKTFEFFSVGSSNSSGFLIEVSDTW